MTEIGTVTTADVRAMLMGTFTGACERTDMYARSGEAAEALCWHVLGTLAFIDSKDFHQTWRDMASADFGPLGPSSMEGELGVSPAAAEVIAWFADVAARFGWITVPPLSDHDWRELLASEVLREPTGWTRRDVIERLPAASLIVGRRIHCYAPPSPDGRWLYVDIANETSQPRQSPDTPVRSVRVPGPGRMRDRTVLAGVAPEQGVAAEVERFFSECGSRAAVKFPTGWLGRPYDNLYELVGIEATPDRLRFDLGGVVVELAPGARVAERGETLRLAGFDTCRVQIEGRWIESAGGTLQIVGPAGEAD